MTFNALEAREIVSANRASDRTEAINFIDSKVKELFQKSISRTITINVTHFQPAYLNAVNTELKLRGFSTKVDNYRNESYLTIIA